MAYVINKTNGAQITVVSDGTIDNTLDIKLIGKNYGGYGEVQNENAVFMLENFANTTQPPKPMTGQLWYDTATKKLKYYDSTIFRGLGSIEISSTAPDNPVLGDFWYAIDTKQLKVFNGTQFSLIGPQAVPGAGVTEMVSMSVIDMDGNTHAIIAAIVSDSTVFIISTDPAFILDPAENPIVGFSKIYQGITVANVIENNGVISSTPNSYKYNGTATDSDRLEGYSASDFVRNTDPIVFDYAVRFLDAGFTVGDHNDLRVFINGTTPVIQNQIGNNIEFKTTVDGNTITKLQIVGNNTVPGADNTTDLGSSTLKFKKLYVYEIETPNINGGIPFSLAAGTRMLFANPTAPIGWVQVISNEADNRMLRVVSSAGGGVGGSQSPITMNVVPSHTHVFMGSPVSSTHNHPATASGQTADHVHWVGSGVFSGMAPGGYGGGSARYDNGQWTGGTNSDHSHYITVNNTTISFTPTGNISSNSGAANWTPRYLDLILCSKT